jgi:hypothetical protein
MGAMAKSLVLTLSDGTLVYYLLGGETDPRMRFVKEGIKVDTDIYQISDIKNFYISNEDDPVGINDAQASKGSRFSANTFIVNAEAVKTVKVYAANGTEVEANVTEVDGQVSVNLNGLKRGIYVVSTGKASFKVLKK